jgi:hypothetical protein
MMVNKSKPTIDEVLVLYDDIKLRYDESGLWSQFEEDEKFYELDFKDKLLLPTEFMPEGIILPTARDIVDTVVDHTDIYNVRVWANRKGTSPRSETEANMLRKFGLGVLYRNNVEATIAPARVAAKHYWLHGLGNVKTVWDADRWVGRPERTDGEDEKAFARRVDEWRSENHDSIPIVILPVHPRNMMYDLYHDGGMFAFETREELCFNVKQRFPKWGNPKTKKVTDKVEHISFWSKDFRAELYDREPVLGFRGGVAQHTYGFIPYVAIDTGLGNQSADNSLKKRYIGVLRYILDMLVSESRNYSIGDIILKKNAWPWGYLKGPNAANVTSITQGFGHYEAMPDGVEIIDMIPKLPPEALLTWLGTAAGYLAGHATPNVTRGMGETGVRSGADRRILLAEASSRYLYSNEAFRHGMAKVLENCARIMKNVIPGNFNVWAKTPTDEFDIEIDKAKMKEPFTFYVEFSPTSEEDEYRRHDDLERLYKSGIITKRTARKQMSNVDPDQLEVEEHMELLAASPMIQQLEDQYMAALYAQKIQALQAAEGPPPIMAQPPGPGMPGMSPEMGAPGVEPGRRLASPVPNNAPIGSGAEMQNKLKAARSPKSLNPMQGIGGGGNR